LAADLYCDFRQAVDRPEDEIDLGRAALTIAKGDYPDLNVDIYLSRIDQLAALVARRVAGESGAYPAIAALNTVLFRDQGFRGNRDDYFDPKNSFLNEVIERKTGIPITLSVLYMEVARRVGLPLRGVGFPGHFLVKYDSHKEKIVIDPFNGGDIRSPAILEKMLRDLYGGKVAFHPDFLEPVTKKQILRRMLTNLKVIYLRDNDLMKGLSVMERLVILDPSLAEDIRDRGMIYLKLECFRQALEDLENYLRRAPQADDAIAVREHVVNLTKQVTRLH
jgi:regulator of sirC expression with transglutaminase-like and TPR domain